MALEFIMQKLKKRRHEPQLFHFKAVRPFVAGDRHRERFPCVESFLELMEWYFEQYDNDVGVPYHFPDIHRRFEEPLDFTHGHKKPFRPMRGCAQQWWEWEVKLPEDQALIFKLKWGVS